MTIWKVGTQMYGDVCKKKWIIKDKVQEGDRIAHLDCVP